MKILHKLKRLAFALLILFTAYSCAPNAEKKLNKGIELYKEGEIKRAIINVEEGLINIASLKIINDNDILYGDNVLYSKREKSYRIHWPLKLDIDISNNYNIFNYNQNTQKFGLSNGFDIKIYDAEGKLIKTLGPVKDENPEVKAFININDKIYYYKDKRIYVYDLLTDNEEFLTNDQFLKPFTDDTYNVKFYYAENILVIILGIAGKYNMNIIDLSDNSIIQKNVKTASFKVIIKNDAIYYLSGDAGKYSLVKTDIRFRKKENMINYESLVDIEFFANGIVYEEKDGLWISNFNGDNRQRIPFNYELAGECNNNPILKYLNSYYIVDMNIFLNKVEYIKEIAPTIFSNLSNQEK